MLPDTMICLGQPVWWAPGAVWDSYAFQQHLDDDANMMPWDPVGFNGSNQIMLRSKTCKEKLSDSDGDDIKARVCRQCQYIPNSAKFLKFMERNNEANLSHHVPWKYMNWRQMRQALIKYREIYNQLKLKVNRLLFFF